ncbi:Putative ATPase subunit of terminase (gpP-like) [Apibacter mensalis]|uniref:Putative ATPase subunit of terminase (GpP-like) n=1 Tax=Apibacter mensalis TaxID=1586267 RepID=A0A0X3AS03_9FLAO|nr:phage terminase small subunit-related protein [Apibacter mensalis]CVK17114.1 Putative ATPase subunit of terminase (gpP-like) [Apibacter mensalis]
MGLNKSQEREYARMLFTQMGFSQKEIAAKVGVTEKTIGKWKTEENWEQLKTVLTTTRSNIVKNLQRQMELWQLQIGDNLATSKEVDILVKLAASIKSLETETGISETVDTGMKFISFLQLHNLELAKQVTHWFDLFIKSKI